MRALARLQTYFFSESINSIVKRPSLIDIVSTVMKTGSTMSTYFLKSLSEKTCELSVAATQPQPTSFAPFQTSDVKCPHSLPSLHFHGS